MGMTYDAAYDRLHGQGLIMPIGPFLEPRPENRTASYDPNAYCKYHQGKGHNTEKCWRLKDAIQDLIDANQLPVPLGGKKPNIQTGPLSDALAIMGDEVSFDPSILIQPVNEPLPEVIFISSTEEVNGIWDSDDEDIYLKDIACSSLGTSEDVWGDFEVKVLTRSGQLQQPNPPPHPPQSHPIVDPIDPVNSDVVKQLQKTKVEMNVWKLLATSHEHRKAVMNALVKIGVDDDMTPQGLVNFLTTELPSTSNLISFSDKDLPPEGDQHNKALHLTVVCRQMNVPMSLVDNGSAINVCPLRTAKKLGIKNEELTPSTQGIRAYDNTRRQAVGTIILNITTGTVERRTKFQVVDIKASFNLLLGRPWLHELKAIPSSFH